MSSRQTASILVVDDLESWRDLLTEILESDGHRVEAASNPHEAKALMENSRFQIGIFDIRLVDDSTYNVQGLALLAEAKRRNPQMKAVILTGYPDESQKAKALGEYGADAYLEKVPGGRSLEIESLSSLIRRFISSSDAEDNQNV